MSRIHHPFSWALLVKCLAFTDKSISLLKDFLFSQSLFLCLIGFLTSSSTTRLSRRKVPKLMSKILHADTQRQSGETMTSILAVHIILTPTQPVGSRRQQQGSIPRPLDQKSRALPSEIPQPHFSRSSVLRQCNAFRLGLVR